MSNTDLWRELQGRPTVGPTSQQTYASPRPPGSWSPQTPPTPPPVGSPPPTRNNDPRVTFGNDPTDRPWAYGGPPPGPQPQNSGYVETWRTPTFWDILKDLGLRAVEAMIAAAAYEVAVFFTRRRFVPGSTPPGERR